jgi:hypothetical protein
MHVMADRERRLRDEVLLFVGIAESKEEWSGIRVAPDGAGLDPAELDEPGGEEPAPLGAALRVVPAEPARHDGLCVTAVVLHEHGFELHWHELREGPFDPDESDARGFEATDDVGTEYRSFDSEARAGASATASSP